jgi:hypothetical protein
MSKVADLAADRYNVVLPERLHDVVLGIFHLDHATVTWERADRLPSARDDQVGGGEVVDCN